MPHCGTQGCGLIFRVDTAGNYKVIYAFTGGFDGGLPMGMVRDSQGNLYGTTGTGGDFNHGTIFKLDPSGVATVLYSFTTPGSSLTLDGAGNLYGVNGVSVFKFDSNGNFTTLHTFTGVPDGDDPQGGVLVDGAGNL